MTTLIALVAVVLVVGICSKTRSKSEPATPTSYKKVELARDAVPNYNPAVATPPLMGMVPYTTWTSAVRESTDGGRAMEWIRVRATISTAGYQHLQVGFYLMDALNQPLYTVDRERAVTGLEILPPQGYSTLPQTVNVETTLGLPRYSESGVPNRIHVVVFDQNGRRLHTSTLTAQ